MDNSINVLPSPASSPSPNTLEMALHPSRKRLRSNSMLSDASTSSVKRPVSDDVPPDSRSPRTDSMSNISVSDLSQDIDAYMSEQGEADIPSTIPIASNATGHQALSPAEKLEIVIKDKQRQMEIGDTWYLIARDWWRRWHKACTGEVDKEGPVNEQDLGPVNNASLLDQYGNLRQLIEGIDVEYVPEQVWHLFITWYGPANYVLPRQVVGRGALKQASLELFPPHFLVAKLVPEDQHTAARQPYPPLVLSSGETVRTLLGKLADVILPNIQNKPLFRVWSLESSADSFEFGQVTPSFLDAKAHLLEPSDITLEESALESGDAFVVELQVQGQRWIVDETTVSSRTQQNEAPFPIFNSSQAFFNRMYSASPQANRSTMTPMKKLMGSRAATTSMSGTMKPIVPGTLGLGNMGNTCFMNSALQCLAHSKELTEYFLSGVYEEELNPDNPLGMHGAIAESFGSLLQKIWAPIGSYMSYSPREFKQQLQRFAPQFSGYQQHDSQELVAFLLDGLHEDLNRVLKKPYVEKPDWEGGGDLELVKLANKSWKGYMQRNDSVIVDLFQGQYQSTLVCPECSKVSITFDPFMYLTLPLPIKKKWRHTIKYIPWDSGEPHLKIPVELDSDATFRELRSLLGGWLNVPPDNLLTLETFSHRFYKNLDDNVSVGEMLDNDAILCYELPCHAQQNRTYKPKPNDPLILPVYPCEFSPPNRSAFISTRNTSFFGVPTIAVFSKEEAGSLTSIYDCLVERLRRWTNNAYHLYTWEATAASDSHQHNVGLPTAGQIAPEEGDIVEQKSLARDDDADLFPNLSSSPIKIGTKKDIFTIKLQYDHKQWGSGYYSGVNKVESWAKRAEEVGEGQPLLIKDDALFCEFDENMKAFYFGEPRSQWEHSLFETWEEFIHPEYEAIRKASMDKKEKGITLQDCLDEFTKEEKLGEDDLWYCPQCKKHQQATKKFDLWKAPDVLVVHLKRFSNSRTLRDKIDAFVDFPLEGLDLGNMVCERAVAKRLVEQGVEITSLNLSDLDEPLIYDLFGIDEHMGGLGGGHYRAYAHNHINGKWYHFDDSFVNPANATDGVNANAYLLFYRRRTDTPLGGKTHTIIEARKRAKQEPGIIPDSEQRESLMAVDTQLPTPPEESKHEGRFSPIELDDTYAANPFAKLWQLSNDTSSLSPPLDILPDGLEDLQTDQQHDFPDLRHRTSPSSSNEALPDQDDIEIGHQDAQSMRGRSMSTDSMVYGSPGGVSSSSSLSHPDDEKSELSLVPVSKQEQAETDSSR
ncbi:hypothetical protein APHAL10511_004316 [Amanita phalloides]|nr:hypothetical protein APHAL10511_004316 [Amanita phalloides]